MSRVPGVMFLFLLLKLILFIKKQGTICISNNIVIIITPAAAALYGKQYACQGFYVDNQTYI